MPRWRKALLLATLILALVIGGEHRFLRAHGIGGPGLDVGSNCLLHRSQAPSDGQSSQHDCALCLYCAIAELATPLVGAILVAVTPTTFKARFASKRIAFVRFLATGGHKARASPIFV